MTPSLSLLTDFYQLTMAYGYWKAGLDQHEAVFHLFFRRPPFQGGFTIAAGLESVVHYIKNYKIETSDLDYLRSLVNSEGAPLFSSDFFDYLKNLRLTCDIDAIPEGTMVFPNEPLVRVRGPLLQCQLLESPLLNLINFPTLIATKAARVCIAAAGDPVFEFGLRRAQGIDGALTATRASYIGGCEGTSNTLAGKLYGIPVRGTHSHSWVMAFNEEQEAFDTFGNHFPDRCSLLVDTYNTIEGVKKAIQTGKRLKKLYGIRLDSGDLAQLSIEARKLLDEAGFKETHIIASNELDEAIISDLKRQGAKISIWGVGTNLVTGKDQKALDGVYKLSAIRKKGEKWRYTLKLSEQMLKISNPGILQVRRFKNETGYFTDVIYDEGNPIEGDCHLIDVWDSTKDFVIGANTPYEDLLQPIFREGKCVYALPPLPSIQLRTKQQLKSFSVNIQRFLNPHQYEVGMEKHIYEEKLQLIKNLRRR